MEKNTHIFLPGSEFQIKRFIEKSDIEGKEILIIGANSEGIAEIFTENKAGNVITIVDDNDSLLRSRFILTNKKISL